MGVYFYDGWSGLLLLTTMIQANQKLKRVEEIQTALKKQVFQYTDNGLVSLNHLQSQNTGAYTGEGSLIYAYLSLYRLTNEKVYLQYAVKHAGISVANSGRRFLLRFIRRKSGSGMGVSATLSRDTKPEVYPGSGARYLSDVASND